MPRVPTVEGPSAAPEALPGARYAASPAAGAGALLQAQRLNEVAQAAQQWAREYQNKLDLSSSWSAEVALKDSYREFEQGEAAKVGADAQGATQRGSQWWDDARNRFAEGLNERAKFAFLRSFEPLRLASMTSLGRHEQEQTNLAVVESATARAGSAISFAIGDPTPERIDLARKEVVEAGNISGKLAGLPEDAIKLQVGDKLSLLHKGIVERFLDAGQVDQANAYYYANRIEINGGTQLALEKTLRHGGLLRTAQEQADTVMRQFADVGAATQYVEKNFSGEEEQAIRTEVEHRFAVQAASRNQIAQQAYDTARLAVVQGGRVPESVWAKMDDGHRSAIVELRRAEARRVLSEAQGRPVKTDMPTWLQINRMAASDPKAFQALDLGRFQDRISETDLQQFGKLQRDLTDPAKVRDVVSLQEQVNQAVHGERLAGMDKQKDRSALEGAIYRALIVARDTKGKDLDEKERQAVIDHQIMKVTVKSDYFWTNEVPLYKATPEQLGKIVVPAKEREAIEESLRRTDVPALKTAIKEALRKQGLPSDDGAVKEELILRAYKHANGL